MPLSSEQRLAALRDAIRADHRRPEAEVLSALTSAHAMDERMRSRAARRAADLVETIRAEGKPALMEAFLAEYGLGSTEGLALMGMAEALLRVPDAATADALIADKILPGDWAAHRGASSSSAVNLATRGLGVAQDMLGRGGSIAAAARPAVRIGARSAMKIMGKTFVLGRDIAEAERRREEGVTYSYDMLGEAAMTAEDAHRYLEAYSGAISYLAQDAHGSDIRERPGISVKLSALHPRYEEAQRGRVLSELAPRLLRLAQEAKAANMGLNVDAEEADRLEISLDVIEQVLRSPSLADWDGFGVVVQAYQRRAPSVIDWLHALAARHDRRIMVRLVKGAYWDTEIKRAQVEGLEDYPVFTRKAATDVAWLACAKKLLDLTDRIYPQFATHNAHSVAAVLEMAGGPRDFEFQRLHGMGQALHETVRKSEGTRLRIYAPVGAHRDLLAYLVRRLLENGANSSFVHKIADPAVPAASVAADPVAALLAEPQAALPLPADLFEPERANSAGWDLSAPEVLARLEEARAPFAEAQWQAAPRLAADPDPEAPEPQAVRNPARPEDRVGTIRLATEAEAHAALDAARPWGATVAERAEVLNRTADLFEENWGEIFALLAREAGKTPRDAVAELREAVDFLRYYASRAPLLDRPARGLFACISPWNFPLAIFTGQIAAALAAGNAVIAKPAEATPLIADLAVRLMQEAGVPQTALQLLPGEGGRIGAALTGDPRVDGVCFTGSTATGAAIDRAMAGNLDPAAPLIAETGGLNAMIVDATALPEQAVRDIVASAFQSAGQRCSALRMLYVQEDVAEGLIEMLKGAMNELRLGDPWELSTDVGPVIDAAARRGIEAHVAQQRAAGRLIWQVSAPNAGHFTGPALIRLPGIGALEREVFGPVLHVATYKAGQEEAVMDAVNAAGYGLTFGLHSRIAARHRLAEARVKVGNLYINRNQIGAVVGSQPFGGEGLSGTGPKAGGPLYLPRFTRPARQRPIPAEGQPVSARALQRLIEKAARRAEPAPLSVQELPGPTGELNRLAAHARGPILCLGPGVGRAAEQARQLRAIGCSAVAVAPGLGEEAGSLDGIVPAGLLAGLIGIGGVALEGDAEALRPAREALAARLGARVPLLAEEDLLQRAVFERHLCVDTTAAGGNAALMAEAS
ncbi:bifunctional proline dehydrogenase/L-glutamate gamma-semialdehyde dehydrogenase PutA [Pseudoroseicyclus aestuarii]|nr:bifunctional proline dehydrogenase/L-glutamate gamma-semialdehyde dehydrogenase PutA [Pseudoroseicyclus aestuarii]